ncbi:MAG: hypothetical protein AAGD92_15870 [Pseudomonadota bacterium]
MIALLFAALLSGSKAELPVDRWLCANSVEVWCTVDSCAAKPEDETTPMAIEAKANGDFAICAYTGCWEGRAAPVRAKGRALWIADDVPFSTNDEFRADVTVLITEKDGVGFVRVGAIATPLLCRRAGPKL